MITANTAPFERGMKRTQGAMGGVSKKAAATGAAFQGMESKISRAAKKLGAVALAAVGFSKLTSMIGKTIDKLDALGNTSSKLGIDVEELTALQFAFAQGGTQANSFNIAVQRMTRRVAEAAMGAGEAKAAIAELGLDAQKLSQMTPDRMLLRVADALHSVDNQSDRVRLGFKLFDAEGVGLITTLQQGSDAIINMTNKAKALGFVITNDMVEKAKAAKAAGVGLSFIWENLKATIVVAVAPALAQLANGLVAVVAVGKRVFGAFEKVWKAFNLVASFSPIVAIFERLVKVITPVIESMLTIAEVLIDRLLNALEKASNWLHEHTFGWLGTAKASEDGAKGINKGTKALDKQAAAAKNAAAEIEKKMAADKASGKAIFNATRTAAERFEEKKVDFNRLLDVGAINEDTFARAMKKAQGEFNKSLDTSKQKGNSDRKFKTASRPEALSGSAAINQFLLSQRDPVKDQMAKLSEKSLTELQEIRRAIKNNATRVGVF